MRKKNRTGIKGFGDEFSLSRSQNVSFVVQNIIGMKTEEAELINILFKMPEKT